MVVDLAHGPRLAAFGLHEVSRSVVWDVSMWRKKTDRQKKLVEVVKEYGRLLICVRRARSVGA